MGSVAARAARLFDQFPAWGYMAVLAGLVLGLALMAYLWPVAVWSGFVEPYLWGPIVRDEGFNPYNTVLLLVVAALLLLWFLRLLRTYQEHIDLELVVAVVPFFLWGSLLRVLEDSDLFAPYAEDAAGLGVAPSSCLPALDGGVLRDCLGVLFVTPLLWFWAAALVFLLGRLGLVATHTSQRHGVRRGLGVYALSLVAFLALYVAWWASEPAHIRFVAHPLVAPASPTLAYAVVHVDARRHELVAWRRALLGYTLVPLALATYYVLVWLTGGRPGWTPTDPLRPWVVLPFLFAASLLTLGVALGARALARGRARAERPGRIALVLAYVVLLEGAAVFVGVAVWADAVEHGRTITTWLLGPVAAVAAVAVGTWILRHAAAGPIGGHPAAGLFASPLNLLVLFSQAADAFMTALAIDLFGAAEKHVLPRLLIERAGDTLPGLLGAYPAATVMLLYKVPLVLLLLWVLDRVVGETTPARADFVRLLKLGAAAVGLAPGVRDAVRLAMGV
jgi:uncharacterized membrane protein